MAKIVVVYHSGYGHTAKQAEAVAAGAKEVAEVQLVALSDIATVPWADLAAADGIIFGAPTYMSTLSSIFS